MIIIKMNRFYKTNLFGLSLSLFITMNTGCVDLSGAKYHAAPKKLQQEIETSTNSSGKKVARVKRPKFYRGEVHTMLGGLGIFSTGMKELSSSIVETYNIPAPSNMWYNAGGVTRSIVDYYYAHKKHRPIILVGHSLGANEQIKVARNLNKSGIPVDLLVTIDAVSQTVVPANVKHVMNFYKPGYVPMFSGLKLRAQEPSKTRVENINVARLKNVTVNHFTIDKHPLVQAMIMDEVKRITTNANRAKA
jgi:hypothetical protein